MVQINLSASIFLLATAITSSLAYPVNSDAVELQEREPVRLSGAVKLIRHVPRPQSRHIIKGARGAARVANTIGQVSDAFSSQNRRSFNDDALEVTTRDFELVERDPRFGANHVRKWAQRASGHRMHRPRPSPPPTDDSAAPVASRDLSEDELELMAREPFLGYNHLKHWIGGKIHRHHHFQNEAQLSAAPNNAPNMEAPTAREYEELSEREFFDDLD